MRIGKRALKNNVMVAHRRRRLRRHLLLRRAVPADRPRRPALIGYLGGRAGAAGLPRRRRPRPEPRPDRGRCRHRARRGAARPCPPGPRLVAQDRGRRASCSGSAPVARPAADAGAGRRLQPHRASSSPRWRWSPSAAPTRCWPTSRRQAVRDLWLAPARRDARRPRHGRDHARPADHGPPVRRLHGRLPRSRAPCRRCSPATLGGVLTTWVTFVPVLPVDLPRRALHRDAARQQGAVRRALGDHRRGRRRDPQPRGLVRAAHAVRPRCTRFARSAWPSTCPIPATINLPALVLTLAAILAVFRFKVGMLPVLAACSAAGVLYHLAMGGL